MSQDSNVQTEARWWIDSLERKWRLQILSKRFRLDRATGERKELPLRIRRFAEGIPYSCVDEAMRYLLSKAPYRDVIYNGNVVEGEYVPTLTMWRRDDQDTVNGTSRTDGTYTLIQDLIDRTYVDRYMVGSSRSCTEEVVSEWTWDSDSIESIPEENPLQGVTYAIQSVSRNEDGTFNYALVKRTALTQHTPRVTVKVTADETVESESWDNLYGEPPDFVDDKGLPASVPAAGYDPETGLRVEVQLSKNDDCTYKAQAMYVTRGESRTDPTYRGAESCSEVTEYEHHWRESDVVELQHSQGVAQAIQSLRREDDGTYSYVVVTRRAVTQDSGSAVQTSSALETVTVRTVDNVYGAPGGWKAWFGEGGLVDLVPPIPAPGVAADGRTDVQATENEDCTYKVQVTVTKAKAVCPVERQTSKDIFESDTTDRCAGQAAALPDAPGADHGVVETHESQRQPDGTYVNRTAVKEETLAPVTEESWQVGLRGVVHTVRHRHVDLDDPEQAAAYGGKDVEEAVKVMAGSPDALVRHVGTQIRRERTPGDLHDITVSEAQRVTGIRSGAECAKTVFLHKDSRAVSADELGRGHQFDAGPYYVDGDNVPVVGAALPVPGGPLERRGVYCSRSSRMESDGTVVNVEEVDVEIPVERAQVKMDDNALVKTDVVLDRNQVLGSI